jgi:nitroreductase
MMIDLLRTRRSIRKYTDQPVDAEARALLQEALLRSPSSRSKRPWEFVFVDDRKLLEALGRTKPHGSSFLERAALAIVICADAARCDVWVEDCSIAAIIAHLQAHALGLGSCWVQIRQRKHDDGTSAESYVRQLLDIPDRLQVEAIVAIGHPAEQKQGVAGEKLERSKIWSNRYGQK